MEVYCISAFLLIFVLVIYIVARGVDRIMNSHSKRSGETTLILGKQDFRDASDLRNRYSNNV